MNLHRFKKLIGKNNPEKGLYSLPGAQKADRHIQNAGTIRVKGRYIPGDTERMGRFFGMMAYIHAWLYVLLLPSSMYTGDHDFFSPLSVFLIGMFLIHGCAIAADGLRNSNAPRAVWGIKIFWISTVFFFVGRIVLAQITG
ncbi:MAG: hypothetical protein KJO79_07210 [Verrucomicrobiae bacterium]|nr:hypothetical protein [Verrucomicrobiae bacterium]NNJ86950.1 hypothetical protein [Akkermansiaceae bacterium]